MAKRQRTNHVTASYHFLVKRTRGQPESEETGFTSAEFERLVARLRDVTPIDFSDETEIRRIKVGDNIPLLAVTEISPTRYFGKYEGAYYGQEYRNTKVGTIDADSLNLRTFHYLVDHRRDGRIVIGTQYLGNYGDYDGLGHHFSKILSDSKSVVKSKSFTSLRHELGSGVPVEIKVSVKRTSAKLGAKNLFSRNGTFAIKGSDYGDDFEEDVKNLFPKVKGSLQDRKSALAKIVSQGDFMEIDDDDIAGCTVLMRQNGNQYTVYLLGDNNIATKFPIPIAVPPNGLLEYDKVLSEMVKILDNIVTPGLRQ